MYKCGFCKTDLKLDDEDAITLTASHSTSEENQLEDWKVYVCEDCEQELKDDMIEIAPFYPINNRIVIKDKDQQKFTSLVAGSLRDTINQHGPIHKENIGSAMKRVWGQIWHTFQEANHEG